MTILPLPSSSVNWVAWSYPALVVVAASVVGDAGAVCDRHDENDDGIDFPVPEVNLAGRRDSLAVKSRHPPSYRHLYPSIRGRCPGHYSYQNHPWRYRTASSRTKTIDAVRVLAVQEVVGEDFHGRDVVEIVVRTGARVVEWGRPEAHVDNVAEAVSYNSASLSEYSKA